MTTERPLLALSPEVRARHAASELDQSRARLAAAVAPKPKKPQAAAAPARAPGPPGPFGTAAVAGSALLHAWWRAHPLRATVEEAEATGNALIGPHVRRHPALALAGAAAVGAALVVLFPRRGWALALPWLGLEARSLLRSAWRQWVPHRRAPAPRDAT